MIPLFIETAVFEKTASIPLEEDPQLWGRQVLIELFRAVPEAAQYSPEFLPYRIDEERGYGLGAVALKATVDSALKMPEKKRPPMALVPVIIAGYKLKPFDVMYATNGKAYPFTADRLRQALFRPDMFEVMANESDLGVLYNTFFPPGRSDNSFGAGYGQPLGGGAPGSAQTIYGSGMMGKYSMLETVAPTILIPDLTKLSEALEADGHYMEALRHNQAFLGAISGLAAHHKEASENTPKDLLDVAVKLASPSVTQIGFSEEKGMYWVKSASAHAYADPHVVYLSRKDFLKLASEEGAARVDTEGTVTVTHDPSVAEKETSVAEVRWEPVTKPGIYRVQAVSGEELTGWVFPSLVDVDGQSVPLAIFSNGSSFAIQNQIVGIGVGAGSAPPTGSPRGTGVFFVQGPGGITATVPVSVVGTEAAMDGADVVHVNTSMGVAATIRKVGSLKSMLGGQGDLLIPMHAEWMPLTGQEVQLASSPDQTQKMASAETAVSVLWLPTQEVRVMYRMMPKLASVSPTTMPVADAFWYLGLAGLSAKTAADLMSESARTGKAALLEGCRDVALAHEIYAASLEKAAANTSKLFDLRVDLTKEASVLPTTDTVDSVLSLQFINSENIRMYVSKLPYLEQSLSTLCELLIAQRMGVQALPEGALTRAIRGLDSVTQALRAMAMGPETVDA